MKETSEGSIPGVWGLDRVLAPSRLEKYLAGPEGSADAQAEFSLGVMHGLVLEKVPFLRLESGGGSALPANPEDPRPTARRPSVRVAKFPRLEVTS